MDSLLEVEGFLVQESPRIYIAKVPGRWLLKHSTPSWRYKDPETGFQRMVKTDRAKEIALAVLNQKRTFPNAIVLATEGVSAQQKDGRLRLEGKHLFLIIDGQHRLWAQHFSEYEAKYICMIHCGLTKVDMAKLFLEINDNQKRVSASLRWDLVRLVRPDDDPTAIAAAELIYDLTTDETSPFHQSIDLTGEQPETRVNQASLAPEIKSVISKRESPIAKLEYEEQYEMFLKYFTAISAMDVDGWRSGSSPLSQARVLRALIRLLTDIVLDLKIKGNTISPQRHMQYLAKINMDSLTPENIRAMQGKAGISEIYKTIRTQVFA